MGGSGSLQFDSGSLTVAVDSGWVAVDGWQWQWQQWQWQWMSGRVVVDSLGTMAATAVWQCGSVS
jgi:hypothetical protein